MTVRNIKKNLAGMQDLLQGVGVETQVRADASYNIAKVDVPYAVETVEAMQALDVELYTRARVYSDTLSFIDYIYDPDSVDGITPDNGAGSWIALASRVVNKPTLDAAVAATDIAEGMALNLAERTAGNGGGAMWDVVLASTVTPNTFNVVQCTGVPTLALVLRVDEELDVKAFGAYANSVDNAPNIQAAIDAANDNNTILLADGLVILSSLQTKPNLKYKGGSLIKGWDGPQDDTLSVMMLDSDNGSSNNSFIDVEFIGRHENDIAGAISDLALGQRDVGIDFRDGIGYKFDRCKFNGFTYNEVRLDGTATTQDPEDITIIGCRFAYSANNGLWLKHGIINTRILGNDFQWLGNTGVGVDDLSTAEVYGPSPRRLAISGNTFYKCAQNAISPAILVQGVIGASVTGNTIYEIGVPGSVTGNGIQVDSGGNVEVGENKGEGIVVSGNTIFKVEGAGMNCNGLIGGVISGNTITDAAGSGCIVVSNSPVLNNGSKRVSITGNWLGSSDGSPAVSRGILVLDSNQEDIYIHNDNTFYNCNTDIENNGVFSGPALTENGLVMRGYDNQRLHSFVLLVQNNGGTIEHRIISGLFAEQSIFYDRINGASSSFTATPTVSASVDFAAGVGIDDGSVNRLVLDTGDYGGLVFGEAVTGVGRNTTGTAISIRPQVLTKNVNGDTKDRLALQVYNAATGASVNISTIPVGTAFELQVYALVA